MKERKGMTQGQVAELCGCACPACNYECDSVSAKGNHTPEPGDFSICLNCGEWLEFASDMALTIMPEKTRQGLDEDNRIILTNGAAYIKKRGLIIKNEN